MEIFNPERKIIKAYPVYPFGIFIKQGSKVDAWGFLRGQDNPACRQCQSDWEEGLCIPLQEICGHVKCRQCFLKQSISLDRSCPQCLRACPECKLVWNDDDQLPTHDPCGHFRCRSCFMKAQEAKGSCSQCVPDGIDSGGAVSKSSPPGLKRKGRPSKRMRMEGLHSSTSPLAAGPTKFSRRGSVSPLRISPPTKQVETDCVRSGLESPSGLSGSPRVMRDSVERHGSILSPPILPAIESVVTRKRKSVAPKADEAAFTSPTNVMPRLQPGVCESVKLRRAAGVKRKESGFEEHDEGGVQFDMDSQSNKEKSPSLILKIKLDRMKSEGDVKTSVVVKSEKNLEKPECIQVIKEKTGDVYHCQKCDRKYESMLNPRNPLEMFVCNLCGEMSADEKQRFEETSVKPKYQCTICSSRFQNLVKFNQHLKDHSGGRLPLTCFKCSKGFIERSDLEQHTCLRNRVLRCASCSSICCQSPGSESRKRKPSGPSLGLNCDCADWASNLRLQTKSNSAGLQDENSPAASSTTKIVSDGSSDRATKNRRNKLAGPKSRRLHRTDKQGSPSKSHKSEVPHIPEESGEDNKKFEDRNLTEQVIAMAEIPPKKRRRKGRTKKQTRAKKRVAVGPYQKNPSTKVGRKVPRSNNKSLPEFIQIIQNGSFHNLYHCLRCNAEHSLESKGKTPLQVSTCNECGQQTEGTKLHQEAKKKGKYECTVCHNRFPLVVDLTTHLRSYHTGGRIPFICSKCGEGYISRSDLDAHSCSAKEEKGPKCLSCNKKCISRPENSDSTENGSGLSNCPCLEWFKNYSLDDSERAELDTGSSAKDVVQEGIKIMSHISGNFLSGNQPLRKISDIKKLISSKLDHNSSGSNHLQPLNNIQPVQKARVVANKCKRNGGVGKRSRKVEDKIVNGNGKHQKSEHIVTVTKGKDTVYKCAKCNKEFVSARYAYFNHRNHCPKENQLSDPNECNICGEVCSTAVDLQAHQEMHFINSSQEICQVCGSQFKTKEQINKHMEIHGVTTDAVLNNGVLETKSKYMPVSKFIKQLREQALPRQMNQLPVDEVLNGFESTNLPPSDSGSSSEDGETDVPKPVQDGISEKTELLENEVTGYPVETRNGEIEKSMELESEEESEELHKHSELEGEVLVNHSEREDKELGNPAIPAELEVQELESHSEMEDELGSPAIPTELEVQEVEGLKGHSVVEDKELENPALPAEVEVKETKSNSDLEDEESDHHAEVEVGHLENQTQLEDGHLENQTQLEDGYLENQTQLEDGQIQNQTELEDGEIENPTDLEDGEMGTSPEMETENEADLPSVEWKASETEEQAAMQISDLGTSNEETQVLQIELDFQLNECPLCGQSFNSRMPLFNHYLVEHALEHPYDCFLCNETFVTRENLGDHLLMKHGEFRSPEVTFPLDEVAGEVASNEEF